jgi:putative membrane protein
MKWALRIGFVVGLSALIVLVLREGAAAILSTLSQAGWVLLWLIPLHGLALLLDVRGWRLLIPKPPAVSALFLIGAIREAINRLLPVASIGGELVGIRLLTFRGTEATLAAASVTVEILLTLVSQYLFMAIGVLCLLQLTGAVHLSGDLLLGLLVSLPVIALFGALLRHGSMFERIERIAQRLVGPGVLAEGLGGQAAALDAAIGTLLGAHRRLAGTVCWQLSGLIVGSAEVWLILRWLGHPMGIGAAIALESLTQAVRTIIFLIPAGLGVQEIGLIGLGGLLGLGGELAIALSLAKRAREILFCCPALVAWQWIETKRGWQQARAR